MTDTAVTDTVIGALRQRRSIGTVKPDPVPRDVIERVIDAATWAPNHHQTRPWRFVVVMDDARLALGRVMAQSLRERMEDPEGEQATALLEKERHKPLRAPVLIAVAALPSTGPRVVELEEIAAVAAGVQNMLLAAQALGLGAMWRTGEPARDPAVKRFLGLPDHAHLLAFVYLGYPEGVQRREHESEGSQYTTWLDAGSAVS